MAVNQATGYNRTTKEPLDALYLNSGSVYASIAAVNAAVNINVRYTGSRFNVNGEDYWYKNGVQDSDLVVCVDKNSFATTQSFQAFTQSIHTYTQSNDIRVSDTYISQSNYTPSSSFHAYTQSVNIQLSNIYISESNYLPTASFNPISSSFDARVLANSASIYSIVHNSGSLATLTDVVIASLTPGQALVYDTGTSKWKNASFISASVSGNAATATNVAASGVTGPGALTKTDDTNVTLTLGGSPSTALLAATSITVGWTGTLADARITSATNWNLAYAYSLIGHLPLAGGNVSGNILMSGGAGIDAVLTAGTDVLNIGTSNADTINIGWSGATVNIQGTVLYNNVTNLQVTDKLITVNKGGAAASGVSAGFEVEEGGVITGYFATDSTRTGWDFKAPASQQLTLGLDLLSAARVIKMPNASGTIALLTSLSSTATGLTYTNTSGAFSLTSGYVIPTTTEQSNWNTAYGWGNWATSSHYIGTTLIANNRASGAQTLTGVNIDGTAQYATYWGGFAANFNVAATTMDYLMVRESGAGIMKVGSAALVASFLSGQTMNIVGSATYAENSSKLFSTDPSYAYGSGSPYYANLSYNSPLGQWEFKMNPATPSVIWVSRSGTATNVAASGVTGGAALSLTDDTNITITQTGSTSALLAAKGLIMGWTGTLADSRIASSSNWNTAYGWGNHAGLYLSLSGGTVNGRVQVIKSAQSSYSTAALEVYTADGAASEVGISFHRGGQSAGFLSHGPYGGLRWEGDQIILESNVAEAATASKIVRRDSNGRIYTNDVLWFNSTSYYIQNGLTSGWYFSNNGGPYGYLTNTAFTAMSTGPTANTVVQRDGNGYVEAVYFKSTNTGTQTSGLAKITGKVTGDSYMYEFSPAAVWTFLGSPSTGETLASVTARGASTSTAVIFNGGLTSTTGDFSNLIYGRTSEYLRSIPTTALAAQYQTWYNSAGTRRGYFGFGGASGDTLTLANETGGGIELVGSSIYSNTEILSTQGFGFNGSVSTDSSFGYYFDSAMSSSYGIYREAGSWTTPYPDLHIAFYTGIKIGADPSYGGVRFYDNYSFASAAKLFSVGDGDRNIRMPYGGSKLLLTNGAVEIEALQANYFGYSGSYAVLQVGDTRTNRSIAFGVDLTGNVAGTFNGTGLEYIWKNVGKFITPNASNNGYNTLFSWNNTGGITLGYHFSTAGWNIDAGAGTIYATTFVGAGSSLTSVPSNAALYPTFNQNTTGSAQYATYLWATSHVGTYYISSAWNGSYWRVTSNHSSGVSVEHSDLANAATLWGGKPHAFTTSGSINSYMMAYSSDGYWRPETAATIASFLSGSTMNIAGNATTSTSTTLLAALSAYVWNNASIPSTYPIGIQNSFVSATEGFPNYGSVMTMRAYGGSEGGALQLYTPYGDSYGGTSLRFRNGDYTSGTWTAWKTIIDTTTIGSYLGAYLPLTAGASYPLSGTLYGTTASFSGSLQLTGSASSFLTTYAGVTNTNLFTSASGGVLSVDGDWPIFLRRGGVSGTNMLAISSTGAIFSTNIDLGYNNELNFGASPYRLRIYKSSAGNLESYIDDEYNVSNTALNFRFRVAGTPITTLKLNSDGNSVFGGNLTVGGGYIYGVSASSFVRLDNSIGAQIGYSTYASTSYDSSGFSAYTSSVLRLYIDTAGAASFSSTVGASQFLVGEMIYSSNQLYRNSANEMYLNYSGTGQTIIGNNTGGSAHYGNSLFYRPIYVYSQNGNYTMSMGGSGGDYGSVGYNVGYTTTSSSYTYKVSDWASFIRFNAGGFQFLNAPSGTGTMTTTLRAILGNTGNLTLGASEGSVAGGHLYANYGFFGDYLFMNGKLALRGTDTYLRLNQNGEFADGVFTPYNLRVEGAIQFAGTKGQLSYDGTYGTGYTTISFSTNATDGYSRIFAGSSNNDDIYIAAGTGRGVRIRYNGTTYESFIANASGNITMPNVVTVGALNIANDITWTNNSGYGLKGQDGVRFLSYYTAGGVDIGYGAASTKLYNSTTLRLSATSAGVEVAGTLITNSGIYPGSWIYSNGKQGLYNSTYSGYFYQTSANYWSLTSAGSSTVGLQLRDGFEGSIKGYLYAETSGFGLLTAGGAWALRIAPSDNQLYGIWGVNMAPSGSYNFEVGGTIRASGAITSNVGLVLNTGGVVPPITGNGGIRLIDSDNSNDVTLSLPSSAMLDIDSSLTAVHYSSNSFVSIAYGTGAGTFPTIGIEGNDVGMRISVTIGTSPAASATIATITFGTAYTTFPSLVFSPGNANAAALTGARSIYIDNGASPLSSFILVSGTTPLTETLTYVWYVHAIQADYPA